MVQALALVTAEIAAPVALVLHAAAREAHAASPPEQW